MDISEREGWGEREKKKKKRSSGEGEEEAENYLEMLDSKIWVVKPQARECQEPPEVGRRVNERILPLKGVARNTLISVWWY